MAVVTGSARGIGYKVAQTLAGRGAKVTLVDLDQTSLDRARARLLTDVPAAHVLCVAGDVTLEATAPRVVSSVLAHFGRIDVLVQAAGVTGKTNVTTDAVDVNDFDKVMAINLRGIFLMCRAVLPTMRERKYGRILNIASISGKEGNAGMLAYSTSKAAVIGLTKVIGKEFATTGITCNCLAPAVVRTEMVAAMPAAQVKYMTDKIPMQRTGELDELADLICFATSRECSFTTGFCFDASGGRATY